METEPKIVFENLGPSDALRQKILEEIAHLEQFEGRMTSCRVVLSAPEKHKRKGQLYQVRIHVVFPGHGEIAVRPGTAQHQWNQDPQVAIRNAFDAARRQIEDKVRRIRGDVKAHEAPDHGTIARIFPESGYGFIAAADGQEIYFHRNSVVGGRFSALKPGAAVRFVAEQGEKGAQASTVHVIGKHHAI
jgi:cold shock CspA family protein/ribosome-associated translation inhibitor RaiA